MARRRHEPDDGQEGRSDGPAGLPRFRMMAGNRKTDFLSGFETTIRLKEQLDHQVGFTHHKAETNESELSIFTASLKR